MDEKGGPQPRLVLWSSAGMGACVRSVVGLVARPVVFDRHETQAPRATAQHMAPAPAMSGNRTLFIAASWPAPEPEAGPGFLPPESVHDILQSDDLIKAEP